ncbi:MAG: cation:proton antiporter [Acidimicrobiales bacterium]
MLTSLDHHQLLVFWVQILVLFAAARILGELARRLNLPQVVGQLCAGLLLGPSFFGMVWPSGFDWFLPGQPYAEQQSAMLLAVSWFCAAFLLVVAGFETDLDLIRRLGRAAALVTLGSLVVPFVGGLFAGWAMPSSFYGEIDGAQPSQLVFTLFIAVSVAVSALAVVAKILGDLGLMRRDVGQITIAAGMANDVIGWIILGVIAGLAASGELSAIDIGFTIAGLSLFLVGALAWGQKGVDRALRYARRDGRNVQGALTVTVATMLIFGVITQMLGVEAVLGSFVAGVILAKSRYQQLESQHLIEDLTAVLFAPLFFATAGLRIDLSLLRGSALAWAVALLAVALVLKFVGSLAGARWAGLTTKEGMVLGAGLNARGALEIIIATVGLSLGVFNQTTFTIIVMIPLVTSLFASIGLRIFSQDLEGSVAERERLAREEALSRNLLIRNSRILLPSISEANSIVAAQIVHFAWPEDLAATVMAVNANGNGPNIEVLQNVLYGRELEVATLDDVGVAEAAAQIIAQSKLGYGVIAVGAVDDPGHGTFVSPLVDELLKASDLPVVIVRKARNLPGELPGIFAQALVPIVASPSSRAAQELAANLSAQLGTKLTLTHVVYQASEERSELGRRLFGRFRAENAGSDEAGGIDAMATTTAEVELDVAERVLAQAQAYALEVSANADTEIRFANRPAVEIVNQALEIDADLVVMGARLRRLDDGRPSLGPNVEYILEHASQTVVTVVMPDERPE